MLTIPDISSCNLKCSRASKHGNKEFLIECVNEEDEGFISQHHEMPPQIQACTRGRADEESKQKGNQTITDRLNSPEQLALGLATSILADTNKNADELAYAREEHVQGHELARKLISYKKRCLKTLLIAFY